MPNVTLVAPDHSKWVIPNVRFVTFFYTTHFVAGTWLENGANISIYVGGKNVYCNQWQRSRSRDLLVQQLGGK